MIRVDHYSPSWVLAIVEKLDDGWSGAEAVALGAEGLRNEADETARKATEAETKVAMWERLTGTIICAETLAREHRERADEHRQYECYLRTLADNVATLKGEYIAIAGVLR